MNSNRWMVLVGLVVVVAAAGFWAVSSGLLEQDEALRHRGYGDYEVDDVSLVYLGNPSLIRSPATVTADSVYRAIPQYQTILREGLDSSTARYYLLMKEASASFSAAVKSAARAKRIRFVVETGAIHRNNPEAAEPPDITDAVLAALE